MMTKPTTSRKTVLVTGAGGICGGVARRALAQDYDLRISSRRLVPEWPGSFVLDIRELQAVMRAAEGVDQILHMAAIPHDDTFENLLASNVVGTYNVFEAARLQGVRRVVYLSTNHVSGGWETGGAKISPDAPLRADSLYGATKACGELFGQLYSDKHGLSVICLRLGSVLTENDLLNRHPERARRWLSHRDLAHLMRVAIDAPESVRYLVGFGVSAQANSPWDISNLREILGYHPQDDGESLLRRHRNGGEQ